MERKLAGGSVDFYRGASIEEVPGLDAGRPAGFFYVFPMGADRITLLAHLSVARTPEACSWREWKAWVHGPQYNPCLAREPLDDWQVELAFTGIWSGPPWEKPKFFKVVIIHPEHSRFWGEYETYEQARRAMRQALEECWRRAQQDLPGAKEV